MCANYDLILVLFMPLTFTLILFITMIIVPVNYLIMEDIRGFFAFGKSSPKNTVLIDPTISESPEA